MEPLDLKKFVWSEKSTKRNTLIMAITTYKGDDIVVYRHYQDRNQILIKSVSDFCRDFEATYQVDFD